MGSGDVDVDVASGLRLRGFAGYSSYTAYGGYGSSYQLGGYGCSYQLRCN